MKVYLWPPEVEKCADFARKSAWTQQEIEFGDKRTAKRSIKEIETDNFIGKLGEVAVAKLFKDYGTDAEIDWNIYPRGQWDDNDIVVNGWNIDVKATKTGGRWFLIEQNKLNFRQKEGKLPHLFIMCVVGWKETATGYVEVAGYIPVSKVFDCRIIHKGEQIPGTKGVLQTDNYGLEIDRMGKDFRELIKHMRNKAA